MPAQRLPEFPPTNIRGTCWMCGSPKRQGETFIIDLGLDIDFEGTICICIPCAEQVGALVDAVSPSRYAHLEGELHAANARAAAMESNLRRVREVAGSSL